MCISRGSIIYVMTALTFVAYIQVPTSQFMLFLYSAHWNNKACT